MLMSTPALRACTVFFAYSPGNLKRSIKKSVPAPFRIGNFIFSPRSRLLHAVVKCKRSKLNLTASALLLQRANVSAHIMAMPPAQHANRPCPRCFAKLVGQTLATHHMGSAVLRANRFLFCAGFVVNETPGS